MRMRKLTVVRLNEHVPDSAVLVYLLPVVFFLAKSSKQSKPNNQE